MLSFPSSLRIYLAPGPTDMRKSFDGLAALAKETLAVDPRSGAVFVFCNRRRDRLKILIWEEGGFWLFARRLEQGTFRWPGREEGISRIEMSNAQLGALLGGLDLAGSKQRKRWRTRAPVTP